MVKRRRVLYFSSYVFSACMLLLTLWFVLIVFDTGTIIAQLSFIGMALLCILQIYLTTLLRNEQYRKKATIGISINSLLLAGVPLWAFLLAKEFVGGKELALFMLLTILIGMYWLLLACSHKDITKEWEDDAESDTV